jgi:hypothetical protein
VGDRGEGEGERESILLFIFGLSYLKKGNKESMREYAQRLKDLAVEVHPPLLDK